MVPQNWIINSLKIYNIVDKFADFIEETIKKLESESDNRKRRFSREVLSREMSYPHNYL